MEIWTKSQGVQREEKGGEGGGGKGLKEERAWKSDGKAKIEKGGKK